MGHSDWFEMSRGLKLEPTRMPEFKCTRNKEKALDDYLRNLFDFHAWCYLHNGRRCRTFLSQVVRCCVNKLPKKFYAAHAAWPNCAHLFDYLSDRVVNLLLLKSSLVHASLSLWSVWPDVIIKSNPIFPQIATAV